MNGAPATTYREVLEGLALRTKNAAARARYAAELETPPCPPALAYLWQAFSRLSRCRGRGMGPAPIGFRDIAAFQDLTGLRFAPWEVEMIERLDDLWCSEAARRTAPAEGEPA